MQIAQALSKASIWAEEGTVGLIIYAHRSRASPIRLGKRHGSSSPGSSARRARPAAERIAREGAQDVHEALSRRLHAGADGLRVNATTICLDVDAAFTPRRCRPPCSIRPLFDDRLGEMDSASRKRRQVSGLHEVYEVEQRRRRDCRRRQGARPAAPQLDEGDAPWIARALKTEEHSPTFAAALHRNSAACARRQRHREAARPRIPRSSKRFSRAATSPTGSPFQNRPRSVRWSTICSSSISKIVEPRVHRGYGGPS